MAEFIKGDIVVVPFPFSNLLEVKKRPAFVVSELSGDDIILCQITSQTIKDKYSVAIKKTDFASGNLSVNSNVRPNRIFTADKSIIFYKVGNIKENKIKEIIQKIIEIIES
ncbi:type II toxin-antitoxin system PemK/MazF family toxin [Candidatus Nomurabacteria bacterium]|nr:type II toxin-antitoxin system PemK/MazF family toxin [Candidatus Nomurabacteria bacterium]